MKRRFELTEGGTSKFWEISQEGSSFTVRYGRLGTAGQSQQKDFPSEAKASAAAQKLVAEKTGKGYAEVAGDAPAEKPTEAKAEAKKPAEPKAEAKKPAARAEKKEVPACALSGGKSLGARALANAAERLAGATTPEAWREAAGKISSLDGQVTKVLIHLMEHGLFTPTHRLHVTACRAALHAAPPEVALPVLSGLAEPLVVTVNTEVPTLMSYLPVLARLQGLAPDALRVATLPATLARGAALVRAIAGEPLSADEGAAAVSAVAELVPYGESSIQVTGADGRAARVDPAALGAALVRIGGPRWIRAFPRPDRLPTALAVPALRDEPLEQVGRVLSLFNKPILDGRPESPARFFEVAATLPEQPASYMRAAGIRRAEHPDEIPAGGEDLLEPMDVSADPGFARLGTARLDAWAARWLERFPAALPVPEPIDPAFQIGVGLRRLALLGIPFSEPLQRRLIGVPRPYKHAPDQLDLRDFFQETSSFTAAGAGAILPVLARMARDHEDRPEEARALRLAIAAAVRNLDGEVPEDLDALLSLGDPFDYDTERAVREAVTALPIARGERVVARSAPALANPFEELTYAREGASEAAMRRFARLIAGGRETMDMWHHVRRDGLRPLGPAFGPLLAQALAGETLSDSFFDRLEALVHPEALAHVRKAVGENVLDLTREMEKITAALGGDRAVVYAMSPGSGAAGLSRIGGLPAGFAPADVPRHRSRKLVHAFTVDLSAVPELGARYPGARTLSVWVQGYCEDPVRGQALLPRTDAEIAAQPGAGGGALELLRLEVPVAAFALDPPEKAAYARQLLYGRAGHLLAGPIWLQTGPHGLDPAFVAQYDERLAPGANFGDMGICYAFADHAEWQSH